MISCFIQLSSSLTSTLSLFSIILKLKFVLVSLITKYKFILSWSIKTKQKFYSFSFYYFLIQKIQVTAVLKFLYSLKLRHQKTIRYKIYPTKNPLQLSKKLNLKKLLNNELCSCKYN